jgi:hypothetical protein
MPDNLLGPREFFNRFSGRFFGKYRALVVRNDDPRKLGRVKLDCQPVYGGDHSPWAFPCMPMGGGVDSGFFMVPRVGSLAWIEFEEGQPSAPIYSGGFWDDVQVGRPSDGSPIENSTEHQMNDNPVPIHAQGLGDGSDLDGSMRGQNGVPESSFAGEYPNIRLLQTPSGHRLEFDDTEGAERVCLMHRSGSMIEILADGSIHTISSGLKYDYSKGASSYIDGNNVANIKGSKEENVDGDLLINVGGTYKINYKKGFTGSFPSKDSTVEGDDKKAVGGSHSVEVDNNIDFACGGDFIVGSMGNLNLSAGGSGSLVWSNAFNLVPSESTLQVAAHNGRASFFSADPTGKISKIGIEAQSIGTLANPKPLMGAIGPHLKLGNLTLPSPPEMLPLVHEPVVMGMQLQLYLNGLHSFLSTWIADYALHAHPWYSPSYTSAVIGPALNTSLAALSTTFLTPLAPKNVPLLLSELVYLSKT